MQRVGIIDSQLYQNFKIFFSKAAFYDILMKITKGDILLPIYEQLSAELTAQIELDQKLNRKSEFAFDETTVIRREQNEKDSATVWRTAFIRDIDKIMHCPYFNRYADKTQVFSLYKNDDITRRGLHVQLVSRIARTIGKTLGLNLDLIEAISLGHDIGHTPFGHAGERYLDALYFSHTHRHFNHNIHSVRVLDGIFPYNISLQTLDGIACHNGELELSEYKPISLSSFDEFDATIESCYQDSSNIKKMIPCTLEGCVVRVSDMIAYLGKDRQDANRALGLSQDSYKSGTIGALNAEIINNLIVNIIENSYGKPYIKMDDKHFDALRQAKSDNYEKIYRNDAVEATLDGKIRPMMEATYERLLSDLMDQNQNSPIFSHHIAYINGIHYKRSLPYEACEPNQIVVDYIASMTDDYFIDLHAYLFPESRKSIEYKSYFDN